MTQMILTQYAHLNNELKNVPRHLMHQYCRQFGLHSWHTNAKQNPNYAKWSQYGR